MENPRSARRFPVSPVLERWRDAARRIDLDALLGDAGSLTVAAPHPDDETLGCGGLLAAAAARGLAVNVVVLTDGAASHRGSARWPGPAIRALRQREAAAAVDLLAGGRGQLIFADAPDGQLASTPDAAGHIPRSDILVTCWRDDPHPDHKAAFDLSCTAAAHMNARLLAFPLWTLTEPFDPPPSCPLVALDVGPWLPLKTRALACHASQLGRVIHDATDSFVLTQDLQALFVRDDELYVQLPR